MRIGSSTELQMVKEWLREHRISIRDLAFRAGLSRTTIYNVCSGVSKSRKARQRLVDATGIAMWKITPRPPLTLLRNDPSALNIAIETARDLGSGIQIEIIDAPSGGRRESLVGHLGPDGRGSLLPATLNRIFESVS